ncbi:MAG: hypothetical protein SGILL_008365 [Bacillariaceae sp.]
MAAPTAWKQAPKICDDNECNPFECDVDADRLDWGEGLEQLKTKTPSSKHFVTCSHPEAPSVSGEGHIDDATKVTCQDAGDAATTEDSTTVENTPPLNNRRVRVNNMTRLRDKWWDALAQQRRQAAFRMELRKALETRRVDPVVIIDRKNARKREDTSIGSKHPNNSTQSTTAKNDHSTSDESSLDVSISADESLEAVMERCDEQALQRLLSREFGKDSFSGVVECAIRIAVTTNKPRPLRTVLSTRDGRHVAGMSFHYQWFMKAVELGYEECVAVFLSNQHRGENLLTYVDDEGNNVLHSCVRGQGGESLLKLLLKQIPGSNKGKQQQLSKLVLSKNDNSLTPFHQACRSNRPDMLGVLLDVCSTSLLAKALATEDADNQTPLLTAIASNAPDVVLALIMFRGNRIPACRKTTFSSGNSKHFQKEKLQPSQICPLVWAGKTGNVDMIDLLLQFGNQSGSVYKVTEALFGLLQSDVSNAVKLEGCEILLSATANPFEELSSSDDNDFITCVGVAVYAKSPSIVQSLVSNGSKLLKHSQHARRRDPVLRQQPESFFRTLESKEDFEMKKAITRALIGSLLRGSQTQASEYFIIADVLYANGAVLDAADVFRLGKATNGNELNFETPLATDHSFVATYECTIFPDSPDNRTPHLNDLCTIHSRLSSKSQALLRLGWMEPEEDCTCTWFSPKLSDLLPPSDPSDDEVILIAEDGSRFRVNEAIVTESSAKLESAIRFHRMNDGDNNDTSTALELRLPISRAHLQCMMQHFYHGSIFLWPSLSNNELCRFLLELFLVAEEWLCHDLMKEIESRLLHSDPRACFCFSCCKAVRPHPLNPASAQCLYTVDGKSSLLTEDTILDVLGLTEFTETPPYTLRVVTEQSNSAKLSEIWSGGTTFNALGALSDTLKIIILCRFGDIVKNMEDNYTADAYVEDMISSQKLLLLQTCIDDLPGNSLLGALGPAITAPNTKAVPGRRQSRPALGRRTTTAS